MAKRQQRAKKRRQQAHEKREKDKVSGYLRKVCECEWSTVKSFLNGEEK